MEIAIRIDTNNGEISFETSTKNSRITLHKNGDIFLEGTDNNEAYRYSLLNDANIYDAFLAFLTGHTITITQQDVKEINKFNLINEGE